MTKNLAQFVAILISLCGCSFATELIPPGKYTLADSQEFVLVANESIEFHLYIAESNTWLSRQYKYSILPEGKRIQPYPMTSVDAGVGIGRYDWYLQEGAIVREYPKRQEVSVFKVEPAR